MVVGSGEGGGKEGVIIWHGIEWKAVHGKLVVDGGEAEGLPGAISDGEGLIEAGGKGFEKGGVGRGGDGGVNNGEGNGAFAIDKGLERKGKLRVGLVEDGDSNVREADTDEGFVRVRGMRSAGGVKPSGRAGKGRRALLRSGLHNGGDFGLCSPRSREHLPLALRLAAFLAAAWRTHSCLRG